MQIVTSSTEALTCKVVSSEFCQMPFHTCHQKWKVEEIYLAHVDHQTYWCIYDFMEFFLPVSFTKALLMLQVFLLNRLVSSAWFNTEQVNDDVVEHGPGERLILM